MLATESTENTEGKMECPDTKYPLKLLCALGVLCGKKLGERKYEYQMREAKKDVSHRDHGGHRGENGMSRYQISIKITLCSLCSLWHILLYIQQKRIRGVIK